MFSGDLHLPIDLVKLHGISNGDIAVIHEISGEYFLQANEILESIGQAADLGDHDKIKRLTHKLRGSSVTMGIDSVRDILLKIDKSIDDQNDSCVRPLIDEASYKLGEIFNFIKTYLPT